MKREETVRDRAKEEILRSEKGKCGWEGVSVCGGGFTTIVPPFPPLPPTIEATWGLRRGFTGWSGMSFPSR